MATKTESNKIAKKPRTRKQTNKEEDPLENADIMIEHNHPIAQSINKFLHRARDIKSAANIHIPLSLKRKKQRFTEIAKSLEGGEKLLKGKSKGSEILGISKTIDAFRKLERLIQSDVPKILETSLFLGLFSSYDAFTGDLLKSIYIKKPELFNNLNRSIQLSEVVKFESFDEMKNSLLLEEIEDFRRNSYVEQFEKLEKTFDLKLKEFEHWSQFVECGQRRNLITHNDGIVNEHYLNICVKEGYIFSEPVSVGDKLTLSASYLQQSCELMMEVAFKLGETLWRKIFPEELNESDEHIVEVIYEDCLQTESWDRAIIFGEFAINQKKVSKDEKKKINTINLAIALKFSGKKDEVSKVLSSIDWSGSSADFKLAEAVLLDKFEEASTIMERMGKEGEIIDEHSYHRFPLFKEFRKSEDFLRTYKKIYGYTFADELKRNADKKQVVATKQIEKQDNEAKLILDKNIKGKSNKNKKS